MKLLRPLPLRALVLAVLLVPSLAFAQTAPPRGDGLPAVTVPIAVTTLVSLLLGLVNMVAQGSILNLVTVPKAWAAPATIGASFLTGVGSFLATASQPWTGSTAFYALSFGLFGLFGGSLPAFALHAHTVLPRQIRAMRTASATTLSAMALVLGLGALATTQAGCTAQEAQSAATEGGLVLQIVVTDLASGKTKDQILQDVGQALGGKTGVAVASAVIAAIDLAEALGLIPNLGLDHAHAIRAEVVTYKASLPPPASLPLTATPALR